MAVEKGAKETIVQPEKLTGVMSAMQVKEAIVDGVGDKIKEAIENLGVIMKIPTAAESRRLRQEELLEKRKMEMRREEAKFTHEERERVVNACRLRGHVKNDARRGVAHAWRGNLNSDGCIRPMCLTCGLQLPPFKAPDTIKSGSSVNEWFERIPSLNETQLVQWSHDSNPEWWKNEEDKANKRKQLREAFRMTYEPDSVQEAAG